MGRELLIMRHAKSSWETDVPTDFMRPLNPRGNKHAPRMGRWLRAQGLVPDHVVASPAERARQTALHVCEALGFAADKIRWEERVYPGDRSSLLEVLAACPGERRRVLLVGHNPALEDLAEYLADGPLPQTSEGKVLPTAAVAYVALPDQWHNLPARAGQLLGLFRPRELPDQD